MIDQFFETAAGRFEVPVCAYLIIIIIFLLRMLKKSLSVLIREEKRMNSETKKKNTNYLFILNKTFLIMAS